MFILLNLFKEERQASYRRVGRSYKEVDRAIEMFLYSQRR